MKKKSKQRKKSKASPIKKLKDKAWSLCSTYIRLLYSDVQGFVQCYTCGCTKPYKQMQAGHGFPGRGKAVLFMEDVIKPQCMGCNIFQGGKLDVFTYKLRKEYGVKKFDILYHLAHSNAGQWKTWELEEIIEMYKQKLEVLP